MRGSALNFVPRGIPGGRNFCPAYAGRNGFPLERGAFATRCFGLLHRLDGQHGLGRDAGGPVVDFAQLAELLADEIGRASCRERV